MHAADTTRRENLDARALREDHRRGDGRSGPAARLQRHGQRSAGSLDWRLSLRQLLELHVAQPNQDLAASDGDGCRFGARGAHRRLGPVRGLEVARPRQTMSDQRGFEGDARSIGHRSRLTRGEVRSWAAASLPADRPITRVAIRPSNPRKQEAGVKRVAGAGGIGDARWLTRHVELDFLRSGSGSRATRA